MTGGEIGDELLPHPTTRELAGLGVGETPLEIIDMAIVRGLLAKV